MPKKKETKSTQKRVKKSKASPATEGRSIWKGYISFGLVNIPIVIYSAEKPAQEVHFKLLDKQTLSGIRYLRINEETGKEVPWEDIVKGYEYETGEYAVLTEKDLAAVAVENPKTIEIENFIKLDDLGTMYFEKPYYVLPSKQGEKGYVLLREVLKSTHKIGIAKLMIRTHLYLAAIIPHENALIINTLRYPQEIKKPSEVNAPDESLANYKISKKEFEIATQLVSTMTVKWDPKHYVNDYRDNLIKLIEEKIAQGGKMVAKHAKEQVVKKTNVIDFMDLLKKSVKQKASGVARATKPKTAHKKPSKKKRAQE